MVSLYLTVLGVYVVGVRIQCFTVFCLYLLVFCHVLQCFACICLRFTVSGLYLFTFYSVSLVFACVLLRFAALCLVVDARPRCVVY